MTKKNEKYLISGEKDKWEVVIGLEVHAQVTSNSKLFSGSSTKFGAEPNTQVSLVDSAFPGMLPVLNEYCIQQAVKTGLGLNAKINTYSVFDRKNYFYADLPQGYQISQYKNPIVGEGKITLDLPDGAKTIGIERLHLEQDAGKSIHDLDPSHTYVDLNRSGVALMEIVSKPDLRSPDEVNAYVKKIRSIMRYLGTCDGNMQNGSLRADVNVSVCLPGDYEKYQATQDFDHLGTRCEIKNMNSMRFMQAAIDFEARRQIAILEDGGIINQETRLYDADKNETRSMRSKEEAHDYRYFPCPDLLPLEIEQNWVDDLEAKLPELPDAKKLRFISSFNLSNYDAGVLTAEKQNATYFEQVARGRDGKTAANWVINELFGRMKKEDAKITDCPVSPDQLGGIIDLIAEGEISGKIAKELFEIVYTEGGNPADIVNSRNMKQVTDTGAIEAAVEQIIKDNPIQVDKAKQNPKLAGWFVGQVIKATGGKANPQVVNQIVASKLKL